MADLLDIAPSTAVEAVWIDGERIVVRGLSINTMASIIARFPDLKSIAGGDIGDILMRLITGCGAAIGPIIAAGVGKFGDKDYEARAASLLPEQTLKLLGAIVRLTFPNGIGSFVQELTAMIGGASGGAGAKVLKLRLKKSPSASSPSSDAGSHQTMQ